MTPKLPTNRRKGKTEWRYRLSTDGQIERMRDKMLRVGANWVSEVLLLCVSSTGFVSFVEPVSSSETSRVPVKLTSLHIRCWRGNQGKEGIEIQRFQVQHTFSVGNSSSTVETRLYGRERYFGPDDYDVRHTHTGVHRGAWTMVLSLRSTAFLGPARRTLAAGTQCSGE